MPVAALALAALFAAEVGWAWHKTPLLFKGEPSARVAARARGLRVARRGRARHRRAVRIRPALPRRVGARRRGHAHRRPAGRPAPRARRAGTKPRPLGRGVWVLDASDTNNYVRRMTIPLRLPEPAGEFEARVFGPFLVIRSRGPTGTPLQFLQETRAVMVLGRELYLGAADINLHTALVALGRLGYRRRALHGRRARGSTAPPRTRRAPRASFAAAPLAAAGAGPPRSRPRRRRGRRARTSAACPGVPARPSRECIPGPGKMRTC